MFKYLMHSSPGVGDCVFCKRFNETLKMMSEGKYNFLLDDAIQVMGKNGYK